MLVKGGVCGEGEMYEPIPLHDPPLFCRPLVSVCPEQKLMKLAESLSYINVCCAKLIIEVTHVAEAACPSAGVWFPSEALPV